MYNKVIQYMYTHTVFSRFSSLIDYHKMFSTIQFSSVQALSRVRLFVTPWTVAHQAPPSMGFSRQEDLSGVPLPSPKTQQIGRAHV